MSEKRIFDDKDLNKGSDTFSIRRSVRRKINYILLTAENKSKFICDAIIEKYEREKTEDTLENQVNQVKNLLTQLMEQQTTSSMYTNNSVVQTKKAKDVDESLYPEEILLYEEPEEHDFMERDMTRLHKKSPVSKIEEQQKEDAQRKERNEQEEKDSPTFPSPILNNHATEEKEHVPITKNNKIETSETVKTNETTEDIELEQTQLNRKIEALNKLKKSNW